MDAYSWNDTIKLNESNQISERTFTIPLIIIDDLGKIVTVSVSYVSLCDSRI